MSMRFLMTGDGETSKDPQSLLVRHVITLLEDSKYVPAGEGMLTVHADLDTSGVWVITGSGDPEARDLVLHDLRSLLIREGLQAELHDDRLYLPDQEVPRIRQARGHGALQRGPDQQDDACRHENDP